MTIIFFKKILAPASKMIIPNFRQKNISYHMVPNPQSAALYQSMTHWKLLCANMQSSHLCKWQSHAQNHPPPTPHSHCHCQSADSERLGIAVLLHILGHTEGSLDCSREGCLGGNTKCSKVSSLSTEHHTQKNPEQFSLGGGK